MTDKKAKTAAPIYKPKGFDVKQRQLLVAGQAVQSLADHYGTPFYVYDHALCQKRVVDLKAVMPDFTHIHYAIKANPMPDLVAKMAGWVDGLDVASGGELDVALVSGISPKNISFAGPAKQDWELEKALKAGVVVNVESAGELRRLSSLAQKHSQRARIAFRVNPDFELKSSGMKMGGGPKPFGIDAETLPEMLRDISQKWLDIEGLHIFTGSQNLKLSAIEEGLVNTLNLAKSLSREMGISFKHVNIGGGLGVPYFPGDLPLDLGEVGALYQKHLNKAKQEMPGVQFIMELGRFLVAEAGLYVTRVVDKKQSRGKTFLACDGGMHHHLSLSGNFGQIVRRNYPLDIANKMTTPKQDFETVDIVGPLCTPLDRLGDNVSLPRAEVGDLVVVYQSGAYGFTASPQAFLGHQPPKEVLL